MLQEFSQPNQDSGFSRRAAFFNCLTYKVGHIMAKDMSQMYQNFMWSRRVLLTKTIQHSTPPEPTRSCVSFQGRGSPTHNSTALCRVVSLVPPVCLETLAGPGDSRFRRSGLAMALALEACLAGFLRFRWRYTWCLPASSSLGSWVSASHHALQGTCAHEPCRICWEDFVAASFWLHAKKPLARRHA